MVKHTQTIRPNCLSVFDHFMGLALKELRVTTTACQLYWQSGLKQQKSPIFFQKKQLNPFTSIVRILRLLFQKADKNQGIFQLQLFDAYDSRTREAALFQNIFNFFTFLPKFSNDLFFCALFVPFSSKIASMPLLSRIGPENIFVVIFLSLFCGDYQTNDYSNVLYQNVLMQASILNYSGQMDRV